ncbi:MAG: hypothetical protein Q8R79_04590 [Legionellaceae bacterium]|nr:hypothetical protein [Legionellaceae bacterium]
MLKKICLFMVSISCLSSVFGSDQAVVSSAALASNVHPLGVSASMNYELAPNSPQVFPNFMPWTVKGVCEVSTIDEADEIEVRALVGKGSLNDQVIVANDVVMITVKSGDKFTVTADKGAKVQLTNLGLNTVHAVCSNTR